MFFGYMIFFVSLAFLLGIGFLMVSSGNREEDGFTKDEVKGSLSAGMILSFAITLFIISLRIIF